MHFSSILLACLPTAMAAASLAYKAPPELLSIAESNPQSCILPDHFVIKNFQAYPAGNATNATNSAALSSYKFTYVNTATNISTKCNYHPGSVGHGLPLRGHNKTESLKQFSCRDKNVSFVWSRKQSKMTMVQKICPDNNG